MPSLDITNSQPLILQLLLDRGLLDANKLDIVHEAHAKDRGLLESMLVKLGLVGDRQIAEAYSQYLMVPLMPEMPDDTELDPELAALLPEKLCRESLLVPVSRPGVQGAPGETLEVAFVSPDDLLLLDELQLLTGMTIRPLIGPLEDVSRLIETLYSARQARPEFAGTDEFAKSAEEEQQPDDERTRRRDPGDRPAASARPRRPHHPHGQPDSRAGAADRGQRHPHRAVRGFLRHPPAGGRRRSAS